MDVTGGVEIWDTVPGFPGYKISSWGNITTSKGVPVEPKKDQRGHLYVTLRTARWHARRVARLVLLTFLGTPINGFHKPFFRDKDLTNCRLANLKWKQYGLPSKATTLRKKSWGPAEWQGYRENRAPDRTVDY